jgi:ClpP class serine protease
MNLIGGNMSNILLANEDLMRSRIERMQQAVSAKLSRLNQSRAPESVNAEALGEWFVKIKSEMEEGEYKRQGNIAVINITGMLDYRYDFWSWLYDCSCYMGIKNAVKAASLDSSVNKIVLNVDSCGGLFFGCQEAADAIYEARSAKEIVAVVDPESASAGYWLASQASRIVIVPSGWAGSLGSQIGLTSYYRMYQEAGIDKELIRASISPDKNLGASNEPISDKAREERQRWADHAGELFIGHVERGRGRTRQQILDNFGQGTMYFADDAVSRGMVDSIGSLQDELAQVPASQLSSSSAVRSSVRSELGALDCI